MLSQGVADSGSALGSKIHSTTSLVGDWGQAPPKALGSNAMNTTCWNFPWSNLYANREEMGLIKVGGGIKSTRKQGRLRGNSED